MVGYLRTCTWVVGVKGAQQLVVGIAQQEAVAVLRWHMLLLEIEQRLRVAQL